MSLSRDITIYAHILSPGYVEPTQKEIVAAFMKRIGATNYTHIHDWLVEADGKLYMWIDEANPEEAEARKEIARAWEESKRK